LSLARAAAQNGNTVAAENYYQHAEHYFRSMVSGSRSPAGFIIAVNASERLVV